MIAAARPMERRGRRETLGPPRINLLPEAIQTRIALRGLLRRWGAALGTICLILLLGIVAARTTDQGAMQLRLLLAGEEERIRQEERTAAKLNAQSESLRRRVRELVAVRAPNSWSQLLRGVATSVPTGVVLKKVDIARRAASATPEASAAKGAEPKPKKVDETLELRLEGLAEQYESIVELHTRLLSNGDFKSVALLRSGVETVGASRVFAFSLVCRRDL